MVLQITGYTFEDLNFNGIDDGIKNDEVRLPNVTIYLDQNQNDVRDEGEVFTFTDGNGEYKFSDLLPNTNYYVREIPPRGFLQTTANPAPINFGDGGEGGETIEVKPFGYLEQLFSVRGMKFEDINGNGVMDEGEPGIEGVTIYIDLNENGMFDELDEPFDLTDANGKYEIGNLAEGTYQIREVVPEGFINTFPTGGVHEVTFTAGGFVNFEDAPNFDLGDNDQLTDTYASRGFNFFIDNNLDGIPDTDSSGKLITPFLEQIGNNSPNGFVNDNRKRLFDIAALGDDTGSPGAGSGDSFEDRLGNWFLRTNGLGSTTASSLLIQYTRDSQAASGEIWDIDKDPSGFEQWKVEALRDDNTVIETKLSPIGILPKESGSLDGKPWFWSFETDEVIDKIRITFIGTKPPQTSGLAFDNFSAFSIEQLYNFGNVGIPGIDLDKIAVDTDDDGFLWNDTNGNSLPDAGETIDYIFKVTNTGKAILNNVTVSDPMVTVMGGPITLNPGKMDSSTFSGTYILTQADIDNGQKVNTAKATGTDPRDIKVEDMDTETVLLPKDAGIELIKDGEFQDEDGDGLADVGETITYSFKVTNTGNVTLTNVTVTDPMVTVMGGPITLNPGKMDSSTFTGVYVITQGDIDAGFKFNEALVSGEAPGGNPNDPNDDVTDSDDHREIIPQGAAIELIKDGQLDLGGNGIANPGDVINYTFKVSNIGNVTLTNVTVTDPMVTVMGGPITLNPGKMDSSTFTGVYVITQGDIDAGFKFNEALASGEAPGGDPTDPSDDVTDEDDHTEPIPQVPEIDLMKFVRVDDNPIDVRKLVEIKLSKGDDDDDDDDGKGSSGTRKFVDANEPTGPKIVAGSNVNYLIEVRNSGDKPISNIEVIDNNKTPDDPSDDFNPDPILDDMNNNVGDTDGDGLLDPGEVWLYSFSEKAQLGKQTNVATATGLTESGLLTKDIDPANYLGVKKSSGDDDDDDSDGIHSHYKEDGKDYHKPKAMIDNSEAAVDHPFDPNNIGEDANDPPGVIAERDDRVTFTYKVTNTGNLDLKITDLMDDNGTPNNPDDDFIPASIEGGEGNVGDTNGNGLLDPGESWFFQAVEFFPQPGQNTNIAEVEAKDLLDNMVTDDDEGNYFVNPLKVEKFVAVEPIGGADDDDDDNGSNNGGDDDDNDAKSLHFVDADYAEDAPKAPVGSTVKYLIEVTNVVDTDTPLDNVDVTDSRGDVSPITVDGGEVNVGDTNGDGLLDSGEVWLFSFEEDAQGGLQTNKATATATAELELPDGTTTTKDLMDMDKANYIGVEKSSGDDDDDDGNGSRYVTINGTGGNDTLTGTNASEKLIGLGGDDRLKGGPGSDVFVYNSLSEGRDSIIDFELGIDKIDISAVLGEIGYTGNDPFGDGVLKVTSISYGSMVKIDKDGLGGNTDFTNLVRVKDIEPVFLKNEINFIF